MALEHFKTQVLLLHSQQSTLDVLSAGFGDRYAVHLATSGTEALNTLGSTPIHVIVSAQDLPGMSGLEALREAKKRSPDTIGILLAGSDRDDGLEALVGDKEVFQIVRGAISPEALRNLIDTATKQVRLLAISESANDLAANVDEPIGEHIVMETSENGSAIISDGTGTLPVLKSHKVQISPTAGGRNVDVLVLTKDEEFLATIKESSRGLHNVHYANTPAQAETLVRDHKVGVLVTDAAMVGSNIEGITQRLRAQIPRLVAVVAGRRDDGELLMDLINRGHVYRFLLKPVSPGRARLAIEASVKHHLEAADSTFKGKARGDKQPDAPKPAPKPADKPRVAPTVAPAPRPKPESKAPEAKPAPSPVTEGLDKAFRDSGRFTETMTGLATSIGKSISGASASSSDRTGTSGPAFLNPKILTAAGAAVVLIGAVGWWVANSDTTTRPAVVESSVESAPSVVETDIPQSGQSVDSAGVDGAATAGAAAPPAVYQALLDEARIARDAGEITAPPESNAIALYVAARTMAPEEPVIAKELEEVINQALALAETALVEQRTEDAAAALRMVHMANPENPRLPFLDAQVAELQLRAQLDETRTAIREGRFEDAATSLAAAEFLAGEDKTDINLLTEELTTARSEQRVGDVLALANQRLGENALISPSNDNARYYYELALSTDAENTAAQQGLTIVASKLVLRARDAIDARQLDEAARFLQNARELDPASSELTASAQALETAQAEAEALRQAELEKQAAAKQAAAAALAGPAGANILKTGGAAAGSPRTANNASIAPAEGSAGIAAAFAAGSSANEATAPFNSASADQSGSDADGFVPISSLKRTNYVVPDYPRAAQRRNITGWVDVSFTVTPQGNVVDVGIMNSDPGDVFNEAATEAISQWRFEPSVENGVPVPKRVAVRLAFDLQ